MKAEGRATGVFLSRVAVFAGAKEEEERHDGKVDDVSVEGAFCRVEGIQCVQEALEDGEVAGIDSTSWVVLVSEGFEESSEYGMEVG